MEAFPPDNYVITESKIPGIEMYKPAPGEREQHQEVVDFKCPQCGAATAYSVDDGGVKCSHCGYYEPPAEKVVGKGAQEFEFKVETMARAAQGWGEQRNELICENCGAHTSLPKEALTQTCLFCGSNKVLQRAAPQDVLRPRFLIPFRLGQAECFRLVKAWLGSSWMVPKALLSKSMESAFSPVFLPYWTFDAVAAANWEAEVGHQVTESYYDHSSKEWKTRTRTEWRWESGQVQRNFDDVLISGTERLSALLLSKIGNFKLGDLVLYDPSYLAGLNAQSYDVGLEDSWESARSQMRDRVRVACRDQASTPQIRNFSMSMDFQNESWRYILLPVFVNAYTYGGQTYKIMVNAQTGAVSGQRPVDWKKLWLAVTGLVFPGFLLVLIGLITILLGGVGIVIGGIGFVLLLIGVGISIKLVIDAHAMDDI